jgi:hypothetical protein
VTKGFGEPHIYLLITLAVGCLYDRRGFTRGKINLVDMLNKLYE